MTTDPDDNHFPSPEWNWLADLRRLGHDIMEPHRIRLTALLAEWDTLLAVLGGDTSREDWATFRPLQLGREEDWSDWFLHLLATSQTGRLASTLFGTSRTDVASIEYSRPPGRNREVRTTEGQRADILIEWRAGAMTHIEVKLWDQNFAKTFPTAKQLRTRFPEKTGAWSDYILLPEESLDAWHKVAAAKEESDVRIEALTWNQVAVGMRQALASNEESLRWRSWAYGYCGAVEQIILGHVCLRERSVDRAFHSVRSLSTLRSMVGVMESGSSS